MTVIAGLHCREGVCLCADSEITDTVSKSHELKIRQFKAPRYVGGIAFAGNVRLALSAIGKCETALRQDTDDAPLDIIESVLVREHDQHVRTNDDFYELLIAVRETNEKAKLYASHGSALQEIPTFEFRGSGQTLANHLFERLHEQRMDYGDLLPLVAYVLRRVKDTVAYCDGVSVLTLIGHDGRISTVTSQQPGPIALVEKHAKAFDMLSTKLIARIFNPYAEREHIHKNIQVFVDYLCRVTAEVLEDREGRESKFSEVNAWIPPADVRRMMAELSMGVEPTPPAKGPKDRPD